MDKTSAAKRILDCVNSMDEWDSYNTFNFFTVKSGVTVREAIKAVYELGMDTALSKQKKLILSKFKKSVYSISRYDICLDDTLIIGGNVVEMPTKIKALIMMEELKMPQSNIYYKVCIRKVLEEEAA